MLTRQIVRFSAVAVVGFACVIASEARAQIASLADALTAPLSCTVPFAGGFLTVQAAFDNLPFPHDVPCANANFPLATGICSEYTYHYSSSTGVNLSQSLLSVSSDLNIFEASPSGSIEVASATVCGTGDTTSKIGVNVCEQREVRFNANATTVDAKVVVSRAAPRVTSAGARAGNSSAFCLIQGPGVPGTFNTVARGGSEIVAGGKCVANLVRDTGGGVVSAIPDPNCGFAEIPSGSFQINGLPVRGADGEPITYGDTTTCYVQTNGKTSCYCKNPSTPCPN